MQLKVCDFVTQFIAKQGVKEIFLVSGGANVVLVDAIARNKNLTYICNHHEQACAMAAEGYARASGNLGVCVVTTGPAGVNTLTGVFGAWADSVPMLVISGQVKTEDIKSQNLRQLGVQEVDIVAMAKPITKYAVTILNPRQIKYHLEKAVFLAKSGRPGPVLLDIPTNIQSATIETKELKSFAPVKKECLPKLDSVLISGKKMNQLWQLLNKSQRPLIVVGHGISLAKAKKEAFQLIEKLQIPVVSSMSGHDIIPTAHPFYIGRHGIFGNRPGNFAVQTCDLLITIGARNHLWNIGYNWQVFAPLAKKVVIDIDKAELAKKTLKPDLAFHLDAKDFLNLFLKKLSQKKKRGWSQKYQSWLKKCQSWKEKYPVVLPIYQKQKKFVNSYYFTQVLSKLMSDDEIIFTGNGTAFTGTNQCLNLRSKQRLHYNVGCASMGWDLPAAIGACFAHHKKRIILLTGDGSIMMNLQELQNIRYHQLPIKIFLFNNGGYLAIKTTQNAFFGGIFNAVDAKTGVSFPDFKKIAQAFKLDYLKISNHYHLKTQIQKVLNYSRPILCDLQMDPLQPLYPKVYSQKNKNGSMSSASLENMYPFLSKEELNQALNFNIIN